MLPVKHADPSTLNWLEKMPTDCISWFVTVVVLQDLSVLLKPVSKPPLVEEREQVELLSNSISCVFLHISLFIMK